MEVSMKKQGFFVSQFDKAVAPSNALVSNSTPSSAVVLRPQISPHKKRSWIAILSLSLIFLLSFAFIITPTHLSLATANTAAYSTQSIVEQTPQTKTQELSFDEQNTNDQTQDIQSRDTREFDHRTEYISANGKSYTLKLKIWFDWNGTIFTGHKINKAEFRSPPAISNASGESMPYLLEKFTATSVQLRCEDVQINLLLNDIIKDQRNLQVIAFNFTNNNIASKFYEYKVTSGAFNGVPAIDSVTIDNGVNGGIVDGNGIFVI